MSDADGGTSGSATPIADASSPDTAVATRTASKETWERRRIISEISAHWVQVIGIVVAGAWVVLTFGLKDLPTREEQFLSESELRWKNGATADTCIAEWYVKLRNNSRRSIDVRRVELRIWPYSLPSPQKGAPAFIDTEKVRPGAKREYLFHRELIGREDGLVDPYSPDGVSEGTFEWVFLREPQPRWVTLEIEAYRNQNGTDSLWFLSTTARVCDVEQQHGASFDALATSTAR